MRRSVQPTVSMEITYDLLCLSKTIRTVQRITHTSSRFVSCAISQIGSTSAFFPFVCFPHRGGTGSNKTDFVFLSSLGNTRCSTALDYVNAKTKVYNFLLFFFLNFLKILYLLYIMNIYKYIYNDDTVIHNNYKMINDKKQSDINTRGENYIKSNKLFFRVVFYLLLLCEVGLDPLPSRWLLWWPPLPPPALSL